MDTLVPPSVDAPLTLLVLALIVALVGGAGVWSGVVIVRATRAARRASEADDVAYDEG